MISNYIQSLSTTIPKKDSLSLVKKEAKNFYRNHSSEECYQAILPLYASDNFQIQEIGVLLCGYIGHSYPDTIQFLKNTVSSHESWKVQEILAMAFDTHCAIIGYEKALPLITSWLHSDIPNVRRAVSEGLRIWTNRPYFKEHPEVAISLLAELRNDKSEYVRKSIGNALKDISKKHPTRIRLALDTWDTSIKEVAQVSKRARAWLDKPST